MKSVLHLAGTRGHANHGWLSSHHSFSFASYHDPERMHFGALRVLNDDVVAPGRGFGMHRHENMEIISIPLEGDLEHKDSMGNTAVIRHGDIQVMSAGTGIAHSEYNKSPDQPVKFLQIWIIPQRAGVAPRYDQIKIDQARAQNQLLQILSPNPEDEGVWIHQKSWFHLGHLTPETSVEYRLRGAQSGVYLFVLEGELVVADQQLHRRDGLGLWDLTSFEIMATTQSSVLVMEVPMLAG